MGEDVLLEFGSLQYDPRSGLLSDDGVEVSFTPRAAQLLEVFLRAPGEVIGKDELIDAVWSDTLVTENSLTQTVTALRQALGDDAREPAYIETLHHRGYRFIAPVTIKEKPPNGLLIDGRDSPSEAAHAAADESPSLRAVSAGLRRACTVIGDRPVVSALVGLLVGVLVATMTVAIPAMEDAASVLDPERVVVVPLVNESGDETLDALGRVAADWISQGLTETGFVRVVPAFEVYAEVRDAVESGDFDSRPGRVLALARKAGAGIAASGAFRGREDSLVFDVTAVDVATGETLRRISGVTGDRARPLEGVQRLRERLLGVLATAMDPDLESWSDHASQPPSYTAYVRYAEGLDHFIDGDLPEAGRAFAEATSGSPDFTAPMLWAYWVHVRAGEDGAAADLVESLRERRGELPPLDRGLLDYELAHSKGDWEAAFQATERVLALAPGSEWRFKHAMNAASTGRLEEFSRLLESLRNRNSGWLREFFPAWGLMAHGFHWLGRYDRELETAKAMPEVWDRPHASYHRVRSLAALGRVDEARRAQAQLLARRPEFRHHEWFPRWLTILPDELEVHGYAEAAAESRRESLRELRRVWEDRRGVDAGIWLARNLLLTDQLEAARDVLAVLAPETELNEIWVARLRGHLAALSGASSDAEAVIEDLAERYPGGANLAPYALLCRARIATTLGDEERAVFLLERLRRSFQGDHGKAHLSMFNIFHADPWTRELRDDRRFEALLHGARPTTFVASTR